MMHPSAGMDSRKKGREAFDESMSTELFNLLWGQERAALPTTVDYAYEQLWKRVIMIGGSEEQRLSDVTLAEQLGMSRTPVRHRRRLGAGHHPAALILMGCYPPRSSLAARADP